MCPAYPFRLSRKGPVILRPQAPANPMPVAPGRLFRKSAPGTAIISKERKRCSGPKDTVFGWILFDPGIASAGHAVRRVAGIVDKFTFLFAGRARFRRRVLFKCITAVLAFPTGHGCLLLRVVGKHGLGPRLHPLRSRRGAPGVSTRMDDRHRFHQAFHNPCRLQNSRAVTPEALTLKTASGTAPGSRYLR